MRIPTPSMMAPPFKEDSIQQQKSVKGKRGKIVRVEKKICTRRKARDATGHVDGCSGVEHCLGGGGLEPPGGGDVAA